MCVFGRPDMLSNVQATAAFSSPRLSRSFEPPHDTVPGETSLRSVYVLDSLQSLRRWHRP